jgi:hypothetical protein
MNLRRFLPILSLLLLALRPAPLAAQIGVSEIPRPDAMQMRFLFYLEDCGPDEVRCVWFHNHSLNVGLKMTLDLRRGSVATEREVVDWATQGGEPPAGQLDAAQISEVRQIIAQLPPSQDAFAMAECLLLAHREGGKVGISQYNLVTPPPFVSHLYALAKAYIVLGEPDIRDDISPTVDELDRLAPFPRPWSVPRVLNWYGQANTPAERKFWAHVLAVSGDPRAALVLELNLGQGDNSADLREFASYFLGKSYAKDKQTLADAQQWYKENHARLVAQASILSGLPLPALPDAPVCPEVTFHDIAGPNAEYVEATVTIDRAGLAHISIKGKVPVERDFPLGHELVFDLRQVVADAKFFTTSEPPEPVSPAKGKSELTVAFDGQKRTIHQVWGQDFAALRAYVTELIYLTLASTKATPSPTPPPAAPAGPK